MCVHQNTKVPAFSHDFKLFEIEHPGKTTRTQTVPKPNSETYALTKYYVTYEKKNLDSNKVHNSKMYRNRSRRNPFVLGTHTKNGVEFVRGTPIFVLYL